MTVGQGEGRLLTHRSLDFKKYDFIKKEYAVKAFTWAYNMTKTEKLQILKAEKREDWRLRSAMQITIFSKVYMEDKD